jgi:hypothetical protein
MIDDPMAWLSHESNFARRLNGREPTAEEFSNQFLKLRAVDRATRLNTLDNLIAGADLTIEQATKIHRTRRALLSAHEMALRVKR